MRRNIAALAARLMAEDGIADYGQAKRKAARQLGAPLTEALPNNAEVEVELRLYQSIYQQEEQAQRLAELRRTALEVMRLLEPFRPYLVGAVADGTAGRFAEIDLECFPDSGKDVEIFLLNRQIPFTQSTSRRHSPDVPECVLTASWNETEVRISVYAPEAERVQRRRNGKVVPRLRPAALASLLASPAP